MVVDPDDIGGEIAAVVSFIAANCFATLLLARASFANYPGGAALFAFNQIFASEQNGTMKPYLDDDTY